MLSLEVFLDVLVDWLKSMGLREFLIHHSQSRELRDLLLELLSRGILPSLKFSLGIIYFRLLIRLSIKLLSTDIDLADNFNVGNLLLDLHGVLLVMVDFITHNLLKLISVIHQDWKLLFPEIQFKQKVFFLPRSEIQILWFSLSQKLFIETLRLRSLSEILN